MTSPTELFRVIYVHALNEEIHRLCEEHCFGCGMKHPNIWYHDCYTMTPETKWFTFKDAAFRNVGKQIERIREQLNKGLKVLDLQCDINLANVRNERWVYSMWLDYYYGNDFMENILYQILK